MPPFVEMLNGSSESRMFETYFGLQNTVSVESLSNKIRSLMFTVCANEQCSPDHPISVSVAVVVLVATVLPLVL